MADGGVVSVPAMMAMGGALAGGVMDKEQPLRGAALGALGGYTGGAALGAMGGTATGMGAIGATGAGVTGVSPLAAASIEAPAVAGMEGALGGGLSSAALPGMAEAAPGGLMSHSLMGGLQTSPSMALAANGTPAQIAGASGLLGDKEAMQMAMQGGKMLMGNNQQQQQPRIMGSAPPAMRPNIGQANPFMSSAPSFNSVVGQMRPTSNYAANPRLRGV